MKVLVFSDIHGDTRALKHLVARPADIYIAAGNLSTFGPGLDRCGQVLKPLGSRVLREWVERAHPRYLFCGHIHECAGRQDRIGATQCINVGKAGYLLEVRS